MQKTIQSMSVWMVVALAIAGIYYWHCSLPQPIEPPGYQESIRRHSTGDNVYDLIKFLDKRPVEDTIE